MSGKKLLLVTLATLLSFVVLPSPAGADATATAVFVGKLQHAQPNCFPIVCGNPTANPVVWSFWAGLNNQNPNGTPSLCAGATAPLPTKAGKTLQAGFCDIVAGGHLTGLLPGTIGPWCGHSVGNGSGSLTYNKVKSMSLSMTWINAGHNVLLVGSASKGGQSGPFYMLLTAVPNRVFKNQSCLAPGTTQHLMVGLATGLILGSK